MQSKSVFEEQQKKRATFIELLSKHLANDGNDVQSSKETLFETL